MVAVIADNATAAVDGALTKTAGFGVQANPITSMGAHPSPMPYAG